MKRLVPVLIGLTLLIIPAEINAGVKIIDGSQLRAQREVQLNELKPLAEQGNQDAQSSLCRLYERGWFGWDHSATWKWCKLAAENGDAHAQLRMGLITATFAHGRQNFEQSIRWLRLAAEQGNAQAQFNLGYMYLSGKGVKIDRKTAEKWYRFAAEQGHAPAKSNLKILLKKTTSYAQSGSALPKCPEQRLPTQLPWSNCFGTYIGGNSQGKWAGDKYVGEFVDGSFNGKGTYYFLGDHEFKGDIYIGEFKDNLKHGQGTYTFADGDKYIGEHKDNLKHGQGTYTFSNGAKYVGEFRDGEYNGQGIFIFSNGDKYVGEFNDSLRHGQGTYTYATGKIEEGIWKDDEFLYAKKIEPATQINIPDNAYASGNSWKCNSGYFKYGDACFKIPENAYASGNSWKCKSGFEQSGNTCKKKPESKIEVQPEEVLQAASGTGFIVSEEGHIVTNHHVIEGCAEVKVHKDGKVYKGNVIANDIMNDLALIKSNYKPNVIFPLSDKNPSLLQDIYVAGFPFGNAISSSVKVTKGVVSSETGIGNNYSNIQIDAAIQPGNSGGPILDDYGNVIGVAVAKLAMEKIYEDFGVFPENTNFGIKSSVVENLIQAHNVNNPPPNTEEINKSDLGYNIKQATLYLSCWMTLAQIKKFSTKKVIFRDLVN